jgi:hypothetical protein
VSFNSGTCRFVNNGAVDVLGSTSHWFYRPYLLDRNNPTLAVTNTASGIMVRERECASLPVCVVCLCVCVVFVLCVHVLCLCVVFMCVVFMCVVFMSVVFVCVVGGCCMCVV